MTERRSGMKQLILASKSPRRKELLEKCGVPFEIDAAEIDETLNSDCSLTDAIMDLSVRKASAVLKRHPEAAVLGSDTIVVIDNRVLGKPHDREEARRMLEELSGRTHQVITGLAFVSSKKTFTDVSVSHVSFAPLSEAEISEYLSTGEADDKAGAYGIQGLAGRFITNIDGDFYAIMGLPLSMVYQELKNIDSY